MLLGTFLLSLQNSCSTTEKGNVMYLERTYTLEKKRSVLPLHTILLFLLGTPTMKKLVTSAMSPWRMYLPDMNCSTVSETNGLVCLLYIPWEGESGVVGALCIIAGFHKELSCGIPSKTTSCYDQQETKRYVPFLCHIPVDYLSLSSSTENGICRCLLYNHKKLFQAQTWYHLSKLSDNR